MSAFEELGVMPSIIETLTEQDWLLPRPVQTEAVPLILGGGDVAVAAETGAGKTGAFCIPILQIVYETMHAPPLSAATAIDTSVPLGLSHIDRSREIAIDGNIVQSRLEGAWQGVRGTRAVGRGKWYYVARPDDDGLCRVGWSGIRASHNLGTDAQGFGYGGTGMKSHGSRFDAYGSKFGKGDAITCFLEFDPENGSATISFRKNDEDLGPAFSSIPAAKLPLNGLHPAVSLKNAQLTIDFSEINPKAEELGFHTLRNVEPEDATGLMRDVLVEARLQSHDDNRAAPTSNHSRLPLALILEPSRELAEQVYVELAKLSSNLERDVIRHMLLVGGGNKKDDSRKLRNGVDIISGTLGCVKQNVENGSLSLENIRFFVLDEADTFAAENLSDVLKLHEAIPLRNQVQTLLFSATLHSPEIKNLSEKIQMFPTWIDLRGKEAIPDTVHHTLVRLDADADHGLIQDLQNELKAERLLEWPIDGVHEQGKANLDAAELRSLAMKKMKLAAVKRVVDANQMEHAMLFVRTQVDADNLERFLLLCSGVKETDYDLVRFRGSRDSGPQVAYSCAVLHGGRRPDERRSALAAFRNGEVRFLVCTDVAARGIDITGLPFLINVTLPDKSENYIHRVGRVGRSDFMGLAVSLVSSQKEAVWFHTCNRAKTGSCKNRKLVDVGGCVLWYNEPNILSEIETRLGGQIEELDAGYRRRGGNGSAPILYGAMRDDALLGSATAAHIESLKPAVQDLVRMEGEVQTCFFDLQVRYPTLRQSS
jgi:ATP-dependent RNA helicase DDX1